MTKEEKIKENYINEFQTGSKEEKEKRYENIKPYIDSFGWFSGKLFETNKDNFDVSGHEIRPKSLSGIENNNGWTKIEREADLPKIGQYDMSCFELFYYADKRVIKAKYCTGLVLDITHYRLEPLIKPEPPLY